MRTYEYSLLLSTGERISITEIAMGALDSWSRQAFDDPKAREALSPILALCTKVPKEAMDDAKVGYMKPLEGLLRTPPVGALLKLDKPVCASISDCAMASREKCSTRYRPVRRDPEVAASFPECWDYDVCPQNSFTDAMSAAQEIAKTVVLAWRWSRYVVISE